MEFVVSNTFDGTRNTDTEPGKLNPNEYISAYNVELVGNGKFFALQNVNGTTEIKNITDSVTSVMGTYQTKWKVGDDLLEGLTIFAKVNVSSVDHFKIYAYTFSGNTLYEVYDEVLTTTRDLTISAINYPENGTDILYFTDFYNELRFLKCEIPLPYSANFLTSYDLSLLRKGANGIISLSSVATGGSLLSGTYQFCYRMVDPVNKRFTKWSSLTNPIHVYDIGNSTTPVHAGIGLVTSRKISLTITPSSEEVDNFDYIQLAVIENVGLTIQDIDGVTSALPNTASLLEIESIPGTSITLDYAANSRIGTIPLTDIVVDLAQIETAKTLNVKQNRLFAGNIKYTDLEFDNGVPEVSGGNILTHASSTVDSFSDDNFSSSYVGYMRDEVYRFGVVFTDENGNKSPVQTLDLSSVVDNIIDFGLTDIKFPNRDNSNSYCLFNSSGQIQSLGLRLTGLTNIPSWARLVEIVRVERKGRFKNVLFQSPIIPMTTVYGMGAFDKYPLTYVGRVSGSTAVETTDENLTPQTPGYILAPKNLFWPEMRGYMFQTNNITYRQVGATTGYQFSMLFPPGSMYTADGTSSISPFVFTGSEKIDFVDFALLKLDYESQSPSKSPSVVPGDDVNTNISGNFYALADNQYYFDSNYSPGKIISSTYKNLPLVDYAFFNNFGEPTTIGGVSVMDYELMQTGGLDWGYKPNIQKSAVVKLGGSVVRDIVNSGAVFAAGNLNAYNAGSFVVGSSGITYQTSFKNKYLTEYSNFAENSSYVQAVGIVNVKVGLGDTRYGDMTDIHEFVSTGTRYTFSEAEVATLRSGGNITISSLDVWGGDTFVGPQLFKVCDSTYSIVGQGDAASPTAPDLVSKWKFYYKPTSGVVLNQPIALEASAQYVQVVVESEYNGEVRDFDTINSTSNVSGIPVYNNATKEGMRIPLSYKYNSNLSKRNNQKIYVPEPQFSFKQNDFGARIAYSDIKIYNSDQAGFDIIRVGNIHDLEEKYYDITKLSLAGDDLYAIQERGITYIPTGERQIEQTDAGTLSVRSGDVIGRPILIDSKRGSQHMGGIVETGGVIYIPDAINKNVYALSGQQLKPITDNNETEFRTFFESAIAEKDLVGVYDPVRSEFWLARKDILNTQVFNEKKGWISAYEITGLSDGVYANGRIHLLGETAEGVQLYSMYTGAVNQFFGTSVTPRVTFATNPEPNFSKIFDNYMVAASQRLSTFSLEVPQETEAGNLTTSTTLDTQAIEGNYRIKTPYAIQGTRQRMRGVYALATITWKAVQSAVSAVWCRGQKSPRFPF